MKFSLQNDVLEIKIDSKGAELTSLKYNGKHYLWNGNPEFWGKHSPILFPIVGTLKNNSYTLNKKKYNLSRHGFARDLEFELLEIEANVIILLLKANDETLINYPFDFELQIKYTIQEKKISIEYLVINNSHDKMPFSIGGHPAFSLLQGFENYSLEFADDEYLEYYLLEKGLIFDKTNSLKLIDKRLNLDYTTFEKDALVFKTLKSKSITILENSQPYMKVDFANFPNLGIWTIQNAGFICIEPWFGYSDTINSNENLYDKEGIIILEPIQQFKAEYSIEIL